MDIFLVLGANGNLAKCFKQLYPNNHIFLNKNECDITSPESIRKAFEKHSFQYVLNCAAITDIELCEKEPLVCLKTNMLSVHYLDKLSIKYGKKFIHLSSNYAVFPQNMYGISKFMSEQVVSDKTLVIRTSFYHHETYVLNLLLKGNPANVYTNMYFNPISIPRVAQEIYQRKDQNGIINIFTSEKVSWYEFAQKFCHVFAINPSLLKRTIFKNRKALAQRPFDAFVKSDINVTIDEDLVAFKRFLQKE